MQARSWRWLRGRIVGLLSVRTSRLARALQPPPEPEHEHVDEE